MHSIRPATAADIPLILELIRALATYEREPDAVKTTEADLLRDGFGEHPRFECLIAEKLTAKLPASRSISTTTPPGEDASGIHLEDLFVLPQFRGHGIGKALLAKVAARAVEQGLRPAAMGRSRMEPDGHRLLSNHGREIPRRVAHYAGQR